MKFEELSISGVILVTPDIYGDSRGFFMEVYNKEVFMENGIDVDFIQDNHSRSSKNVLRGLHYQLPPYTQDKLVGVVEGAVLDVVVDIRKDSETFGQHIAVELNSENKQMLFVPKGCAHGFITLSDSVYFQYKVDSKYSPEYDRGIIWNDPKLGIDWGIDNPLVSDKDAKLPKLKDIDDSELL